MKEKQESPRRRCLLILIEKIPNAMKLTFLFLVISLLSFTATASAQRVSIVLDNAKVEKVLATITHQTGLSVAYSKQIVDLNRRVSVNFTRQRTHLRRSRQRQPTGADAERRRHNLKFQPALLYQGRRGTDPPDRGGEPDRDHERPHL